MHTFTIVTGSAFGAAAGSIGAHYYYNRDMKKEEALTLGARHFVNLIASLGIAGLTKEALGDTKGDVATRAAFILSLALFAKTTKASISKDINQCSSSWKYQATVGAASLLAAMVTGFAVICLLPKR